MKDDTKIVVTGRDPESNHGVVNPPVYHASTILYPTMSDLKTAHKKRAEGEQNVTYGRIGTPTSYSLANAIADIEGGYRTALFPSGLAAVSGALLSLLKSGDHVLMTDSVYGPSRTFCDSILKRFGVEVTYYDPLIGAGVADLMRPNTAVVYTEAPGSLTFEMQDIPAIAEAAHKGGATVMMDNTWASPLFFKPFEHGVDISIQAGTKYIVGHSDVMIGAVTATKEAWPILHKGSYELGQTAGPDDIYLAQRGLRTLAVRLRQHQETAMGLADWLGRRPEVERVLYPALPEDPGHAIWKRDFLGASGLFGVQLKGGSDEAVAAMVDDLELFGIGYSWGGYESLVIPAHPAQIRSATKWTSDAPLLRFHAGLEDVDDLTRDLEAGFTRFNAAL